MNKKLDLSSMNYVNTWPVLLPSQKQSAAVLQNKQVL